MNNILLEKLQFQLIVQALAAFWCAYILYFFGSRLDKICRLKGDPVHAVKIYSY